MRFVHRLIPGLTLSVWLACPPLAFAFDYLQQLPESPPVPSDNPLSPQKIALGKKLFFDPKFLGTNSKLSCNSCHNLAEGGDDNQAQSIGQGGQRTLRSSPTLWNIGFQTVLYWDGRSISHEGQILDHLRDATIATWANIGELVTALEHSRDYQQAFALAYPQESSPISGENIAKAIASFERTLLATNSAFDHYMAGDKSALSASAIRGIQAFNESGCLACHFGANFAGPAPGPALKMGDGFYELFPNNLGSRFDKKYALTKDLGRFAYTGDPGERYMWRVPPLRNIALTAPYFHNGAVTTLEEAVRVMGKTQFNKDLSDETVKDITAFLKSLTGELSQQVLNP